MKYPDCRVLVFAKAPQPGRVMTRLHPVLDPAGCADLHARLVRLTLDKLARAQLCPLELWCSPDCEDEFFTACRRDYALRLHEQSGDDLGLRMHHAIHGSLQSCDAVVLIGTDCPSLSAADIDEALGMLLAGTDVVLGPASDGGYYLVGMRASLRQVFTDIPWGSRVVMAHTLARIRQQGRNVHLLARRDDLDTPEDYMRHVSRQDRGADTCAGFLPKGN